jgi:hypothetical protein
MTSLSDRPVRIRKAGTRCRTRTCDKGIKRTKKAGEQAFVRRGNWRGDGHFESRQVHLSPGKSAWVALRVALLRPFRAEPERPALPCRPQSREGRCPDGQGAGRQARTQAASRVEGRADSVERPPASSPLLLGVHGVVGVAEDATTASPGQPASHPLTSRCRSGRIALRAALFPSAAGVGGLATL